MTSKLDFLLLKVSAYLSIITVIGICLFGIVKLQLPEINNNQIKLTNDEYIKQSNQEKIGLNVISKLPSLGFSNLIANWVYLKFIQYFGDGNARDNIGYSLSSAYFTELVDRDPKFVEAMLKLDTSTSLFAGEPQTSVSLLNRALKSMPQKFISIPSPPYYLWTFKGIDELLFLGKPLIAKQSYSTAVQWAKEYPRETTQNFIATTNQTIRFLDKNPSSKVAQIGSWAAILGNSADKKTTERAVKEIRALGGEVFINDQGRLSVRVPPNLN
jgi:hypothetical protein